MRERHLKVIGPSAHGHTLLASPSKSRPGKWNRVLVSKDGNRVSCNCTGCQCRPGVKRGWFTATRADVLGGNIPRCCFHLRNAARWAPLREKATA